MIGPKTSVVYILAMLVSLMAHGHAQPDLKVVVDNTNNLQRLLNVRDIEVPAYMILQGNPFVANWNTENVMENSLISRAVMAAFSNRTVVREAFDVTVEQIQAAQILLQEPDPRGLLVLTDEEYNLLKQELGLKAQDLEAFKELGLSQYVANLGVAFRLSPKDMSTAEWRKTADLHSLAVLNSWTQFTNGPNDLFSPDESFISTQSELVRSLMNLPLSAANRKALEGEWLSAISMEFEAQLIYGSMGNSEYSDMEKAQEDNLDIPGKYTVDRWIQEVDALMSVKLSTKRGKTLADMFLRNMKSVKGSDGSSVRHSGRDHIMLVLADALATQITQTRSTWQYFEPLYKQKVKSYKSQTIGFAAQWADRSDLFELPIVGADIQAMVVNEFRDHWDSVYRMRERLNERGEFVSLFEAYGKIEKPHQLSVNYERILMKMFEHLMGDSETTDIIKALYDMWMKVSVDSLDRLRSLQTLMESFVRSEIQVDSNFSNQFFEDYLMLLGQDPMSHEVRMDKILSQSLNEFPSESQLQMMESLMKMTPLREAEWRMSYFQKVIEKFIYSSNQIQEDQTVGTSVERYKKVIELMGIIRQATGDAYKDQLLYILEMLNARDADEPAPEATAHRKMKRKKSKQIKQQQQGYKHLQSDLRQFVLNQLRLFAADPAVQDHCDDIFDSETK